MIQKLSICFQLEDFFGLNWALLRFKTRSLLRKVNTKTWMFIFIFSISQKK